MVTNWATLMVTNWATFAQLENSNMAQLVTIKNCASPFLSAETPIFIVFLTNSV